MNNKIYLDCTHTYNSGLNTGIQRVVKNIVKNGQDAIPVIMIDDSYYTFNNFPVINKNKNRIKTILKKIYIKCRSYIAFVLPKRFHKLLYLPQIGTYLNKVVDKILFSKKISSDNEVTLQSNDILLLIDTTWLNNSYKLFADLKKKNIQIITVIYDIIPITHSQFCTIDLTNSLKDWYENAVEFIDGYIAISNSVKDDTYNYIKKNIDNDINYEKFDYFYLGADFFRENLSDIENLPESFKRHFKDENTYLTVSTIEPRKNHTYILDSFDMLWEEGKDVTYVMIGRVGWDTDELLDRIKSHKQYNKKLFLLTDVDDTGLLYAYKNSTALIFASFIEGFGLPIIESLCNNLSVFASDIPIHREIGKNNVLYFDLSNLKSLSDLISNKRDKIDAKDDFKWQSWHQSTEELISKVRKFQYK